MTTLRWLYACWLAQRYASSALFGRRQRFLESLRPPVTGGVIAYPDAWLHITPADVRRAIDTAGIAPGDGALE